MTIRTRLLCLLLPPIIALVTLISVFFYYNWYNEIMASQQAEDVIANKVSNAIIVIVTSAGATILLVIISTLLIANKISTPVRRLKDSALAIAAGNYEENIPCEGPREVAELANTLNTMSECLCETITRLRESSTARERMYGEYECSLLLQHHMFQKVIDDYKNDRLVIQLLKNAGAAASQGTLLAIDDAEGGVSFSLKEAPEKGFHGIYQLLKDSAAAGYDGPQLSLKISDGYKKLSCHAEGLPQPLLWCAKDLTLTTCGEKTEPLHNGDLAILFNKGLEKQFETPEALTSWFSKVLRHFAPDGIEIAIAMIANELSFLTKKQHTDQDIYIIIVGVQ